MEPRSRFAESDSPPFCSGAKKIMSLNEQSVTQVQGENGTEYTLITGPVSFGEGEVIQHVIQTVGSGEQQENIDPQTQVLMLQPITVTTVNGEQHHVLQEQQITQVLGENGELQTYLQDPSLLQQQILDVQVHHPALQQGAPHIQQIQFATVPTEGGGVQLQELQPVQLPQILGTAVAGQLQSTPASQQGDMVLVPPPVGKGPFKCELCPKEFPRWNQLQRHMRGHEDDKPYRCTECALTFNVEENLVLHQATHQTSNPVCPECGKKFSRIASLKAHIMMHEKEESLMCAECGDEFNLQHQLDKHMLDHAQEQQGTKTYPCKQCPQEFPKLTLLREHTKQHYKIKNCLSHRSYKRNVDRSGFCHKCPHCSKTFQKPSQLQRHIRIHTGERPYKCTDCDKAFNQKGALQIHMTKHTGERAHTCQFCPSTFSQKGNLRAHVSRVHSHTKGSHEGVLFECDECSCAFRKLGSLNAHMSRVHSDPQITTDASTMVLSDGKEVNLSDIIHQVNRLEENVQESEQGVKDMNGEPSTSQVNGEQTVNCEVSDQTIVEIAPAGHPDDGGGVQCAATHPAGTEGPKHVNDVIQQLLELSEQVTDPEATKQIQQLAESENVSSDILQQALENSGLTVVQDGDSTVTSGTHGKRIGVMNLLNKVVMSTMTIHDAATGTLKRHVIRKVNGVRWHQCTYCSKEFKKPSDLVRHIRIHTHEKPYKCTQCFRAFAVKSTLTAHLKTHSGIKEYKCGVCAKHFSTQGSLKVHMRLHTGSRPFDCPHCERKFRTSGHRKSHVQCHFRETTPKKRRSMRRLNKPEVPLPDVPLQEPILITDTGLIQQQPRSEQLMSAYLSGAYGIDRPRAYKCVYCGRGFKKSSHLKQHVRTHTGEKPFKCTQCQRSFVSSGVLKAHRRTHTGLKEFQCVICETNFTTNGSLKRHMSTHSEVRPFMCPYCQKTFKTSVNCKKHMKTHKHELALQAMHAAQQEAGDGKIPQNVVAQEVVETGVDIGSNTVHMTIPDPSQDLEDQQSAADLAQSLNQQHVQLTAEDTMLMTSHATVDITNATLGQELVQAQANLGATSAMEQQITVHISEPLADQMGTQTIIGDSLVSDAQLQSTLNQQVFGQQSFTQSLLSNQQTLNQLGLGQTQFTIQPAEAENSLDVGLSNFNQTSMGTSMPSTNINNIFQSRDPEPFTTQPEEQVHTEDESGRRIYKCQFCEKSFKKSSHLKQHIRSHTGEKPFRCTLCSRMFVSGGVLKTHMRTHTGVKDFRCQLCGSLFTTNGSLQRHMTIHNSSRPYSCTYCPETFRTIFHVRRHLRMHKDMEEDGEDKLKRNRGSVIQISEEQAEELSKTQPDDNMSVSEKILIESAAEKDRISEMRAEGGGEVVVEQEETTLGKHVYKYANQCNSCTKSFKKPSDLVRHLRIHTGEKPFDCEVCHRRFTVKSTLDSHVKTHIGGDKLFKCHVCHSAFSTKGSLKVHMRLHTGAKPFRCPHCPQRFRTSGHRKSHIACHFKPPGVVRKRKNTSRSLEIMNEVDAQAAGQNIIVTTPEGATQQQIINIDQNGQVIGNPQVMPISLSVDSLAQSNLTEQGLAAQVLQGVEGLQLQLPLGQQGLQITGLDPSVLTQTVQIDASLLQLLQQQGNINLTINPNYVTSMAAVDPNQIQNIQLHQAPQDQVNQNIIIQNVSSLPQAGEAANTDASAAAVMEAASQAEAAAATTTIVPTSLPTTMAGQQVIIQEVDENAAQLLSTAHVHEEVAHEGVSEENLHDLESLAVVQDGQGGFLGQHIIIQQGDQTYTVNTANRAYVCEVCNKAFKRAGHLKEHLLTHFPGTANLKSKLTPYKCQSCQKSFAKPSQLERHIRIHTGERPYQCELCLKAFNQKNALQIHLKKHSGIRPHQCSYCAMSFTQKGNLKTHIKRAHHADMVQSMKIMNNVGSVVMPDDEEVENATAATPDGVVVQQQEHEHVHEHVHEHEHEHEQQREVPSTIDFEGVVKELFPQ